MQEPQEEASGGILFPERVGESSQVCGDAEYSRQDDDSVEAQGWDRGGLSA